MARLICTLAALIACAAIMGQASSSGSVSLRGNHPAQAAVLAGAARAESAMPLQLTIVLGVRNQAALEQLLADQQNPASPQYHKWLTPQEFSSRFGPTDHQVNLVIDWLKADGFTVTSVNRTGRTVAATGNVATAERAFSTTVVSTGASYGNTTDPVIPAQFDGLIISIMGLDNMHTAVPAGLHRVPPAQQQSSTQRTPETLALADVTGTSPDNAPQMPGATENGSTAFGPIDVETFYDETPLLNGGNTGSPSPDCIALDEDSDYLPSAVTLYDTTFGLPAAALTNVYPDGSSPGTNGDETETQLDIDYAHATAPGTPIHPYIAGDLYDAISKSVTDGTCGAISISFIYCGASSSFYTGLDTLFAQASSQGQSVFISSGDWGAAGLQDIDGSCVTGTVKNVSELASSPHVTAVGGTTFAPQYNGSGNDTSVVGNGSDGTESAWNASGGGASTIFAKPTWQTGPGVPADSVRDVPDVAMIAWAPYVFIGADSGGEPIIQCCWGGTSLSSPLWAGYSRELAVASGSTRLGLLNPTIYNIANAGVADYGIEDVVSGSNTYNSVTGYTAGPGYDQVTGWGSVNMNEFASAFSNATNPSPTSTASSSSTPSRTPTPTATSTRTATATATRTATATATRTATATSTATSAASSTTTATATATATRTATPTATATATGTATRTATATATGTSTATGAPTLTPTPTRTATATATPTATSTPVPSALQFNPATVKFGKVQTGQMSGVQTVTLSNPQKKNSGPITLQGWTPTGDFSVSQVATTCSSAMVLSPGESCTLGVAFQPTQSGSLSGKLTIQDNASNNEQVIHLKGTGK